MKKLFFILMVLFASGCTYVNSRSADFCDPFRFNAGVGPGFEFHMQASRFCQFGGVFSDSWRFGMVGREMGTWYEERASMNCVYPFYGDTSKRAIDGNIRDYGAGRQKHGIEAFHDADRRTWEISINLHPGFFVIETGIDFFEFGDFIVGLGGVDIADDDQYQPKEIIGRWKRKGWRIEHRFIDRAKWHIDQFTAKEIFYMIEQGCDHPDLRNFALERLEEIRSPGKIFYMIKMLDKVYGREFALRVLALLEKTVAPTFSREHKTPREKLANLALVRKKYLDWWNANHARLTYDVSKKIYVPVKSGENN